jgi:hypothetical protein
MHLVTVGGIERRGQVSHKIMLMRRCQRRHGQRKAGAYRGCVQVWGRHSSAPWLSCHPCPGLAETGTGAFEGIQDLVEDVIRDLEAPGPRRGDLRPALAWASYRGDGKQLLWQAPALIMRRRALTARPRRTRRRSGSGLPELAAPPG